MEQLELLPADIGTRAPTEPMQLRPYQVEAVRRYNESRALRRLIVMPTGSGKTVVLAAIARQVVEAGGRVLVLAHREELIDQAARTLGRLASAFVSVEKAERAGGRQDSIVVASVQTMQRQRLESWAPGHFALLIVDECHHVTADSYQTILNHFQAPVLGVTATPDRADRQALGDVFQDLVYQYPLQDAIRDGHLADIVGMRLKHTIDLDSIARLKAGDLPDGELERIITGHIEPMADAAVSGLGRLKTISFLPGVLSAHLFAEAMSARGIPSAALSGRDSSEIRQARLAQFARGELLHLANCQLFTEGFDEPSIEAVLMARPTLSRSLFAQMVGRGMRLFPGKARVILAEFTINYARHRLVSPYELFSSAGVPERVRARAEAEKQPDESFLDAIERARRYYQNSPTRVRVDGNEWAKFDPMAYAEIEQIDMDGEILLSAWAAHKVSEPVTPKQIDMLGWLGFDHAVTARLTKGQAAVLITTVMQKAEAAGLKKPWGYMSQWYAQLKRETEEK